MLDPKIPIEEWKSDCKIDEVLVDESSMKIPSLHSKYLTYLSELKSQLRSLEYYKKSIPASERRSSDKYDKVCEQIAAHTDGIDHLEKIIYHINGMSYVISNIVKWRMFNAGLNP